MVFASCQYLRITTATAAGQDESIVEVNSDSAALHGLIAVAGIITTSEAARASACDGHRILLARRSLHEADDSVLEMHIRAAPVNSSSIVHVVSKAKTLWMSRA